MKRFQHILALLPEDSPSDDVITWAEAVAQTAEARKVTVMRCVEPELPEYPQPSTPPPTIEDQSVELQTSLAPIFPSVELEVKIGEGNLLSASLHELASGDYDLVIAPLLDLESRNTAVRLARKSPVGVLAVPQGCKAPPSSILVGLDYSDLSTLAIEWAEAFSSLSEGNSTRLEAVNTIHLPHSSRATQAMDPKQFVDHLTNIAENQLDKFLADTAKDPKRWDQNVYEANLSGRFLAERVNKIHTGLLVVGSHGRGAFQIALLGSHTADILRESNRPVLVVKQKNQSLGFLRNLLGLSK